LAWDVHAQKWVTPSKNEFSIYRAFISEMPGR
jgi:hypothetical protein